MFLGDSQIISNEIKRLINNYESASLAVAWASINFDCHETLLQNKNKIEKMIVGTHFYQTHPTFIMQVIHDLSVRFIMNPNGVFHPKLYLFENSPHDWECIIGSPNFTKSAFESNSEIAMLFSNSDIGSDDAYLDIKRTIDNYWNDAKKITDNELIEYEKIWIRKQNSLKKSSGRYDGLDKKHKSPLDIEIFKNTWGEYFNKVQQDQFYKDRIDIISCAQEIFSKPGHEHFKDISLDDRKKIAGIVNTEKPDWMLFGSMIGAGYYKHEIISNNIHISKALDYIPILGDIKKTDYLNFIEEFGKAFPNGGFGIATSTRLLAMKRPDYFLCLDKKNLTNFSRDFGIKANIKIEDYWDTVVERITDCEWWNSGKPTQKEHKILWNGRAAFLDSIYYDQSG